LTIPAHYHGSIVAVTLAFMGLTYHLLPRLGFGEPDPGMAHAQPYVYAVGQLLHVLGLVWSGGYGVQRKLAGGEQILDSLGQKAGMGLMGIGGLVAVVGGFMFLLIVARALLQRKTMPVH
jgi:heme/copper-type cytochrome/quinol oxidase subunit 1